jgi:hypothetical protein
MDHAIARLMAERIAAGLKRKSLTSCSRWSQACRVMGRPYPGPWTFRHHPWLREMHDSEAEMNVGQKCAQVGFTETALNRTFFMIDVKGVDCLYVLPAQTPDASDFSAARFDPALELSPHLTKLFSDVKNVGHKRAGTTNLYVRGSKSRSGLKSIPVGFIVLDEVDEMEQDNIPLALERAAGQVEKQVWAISTPTIPKTGINKLFVDTTQEHFFFKCPRCSRKTELVFPQCLEITGEDVNDESVANSFLKCKECGGRLDHETKPEWLAKNEWVPAFSNRPARGFHVNQLYSPTIHPSALARSYLRSQRDPAEEQEFYNSKLGLPHIVEGAGVTDADIDARIGEYKRYSHRPDNSLVTMGVDVGRWLHVWMDIWHVPGNIESADLNVRSRARCVWYGKRQHFEELDDLMRQFGVAACVIDANPERRKAYEFASRFFGLVKMCFYGNGVTGKQIHVGKDDEPTITVDRTSWLDLSLGRFRQADMIELPLDLDHEVRAHLKSPVRVYEKDKTGNPVGRYVKGNDEDHYAHARNYSELALPFAMGLANPEDITEY